MCWLSCNQESREAEEEEKMEDGEIVEAVAMEEDMQFSSYESLKETKSSVEEIISQLLSMKRESKSKSQLPEFIAQMFLNFVNLRQVNQTNQKCKTFLNFFHLFTVRVFGFSFLGQ